jgi:hypothetical protein
MVRKGLSSPAIRSKLCPGEAWKESCIHLRFCSQAHLKVGQGVGMHYSTICRIVKQEKFSNAQSKI